MGIKEITVLGAGQMGSGIAQAFAQSGYAVKLYDTSQEAVNRGLTAIAASLNRMVSKGRLTEEEKVAAAGNLAISLELEAASQSDLVIEAVPEVLEIKKSLFRVLDQHCGPQAIMATNTSSLSITEIAAVTSRPERVIGMHFMNPVPVMPLVELIRGIATSASTFESVQTLVHAIGKTAVEVSDFPGFVSNRILMPMINEAIYAVYEGIAAPEAVDQIMKLGMNHPMGPIELADFIGLDTCLAIMETLHEGFGDSKYRPCPLLRKYVLAGWLGRKTNRGFYVYNSG